MSVILDVKNLSTEFVVKRTFWGRPTQVVKAVNRVTFQVKKGETLGIVGESGCGKSTLAKTIIRLIEPSEGSITFLGKDFLALSSDELRQMRRNMQMIFQDPYSSLDPRLQVGHILNEPFEIHGILGSQERRLKIKNLLELVGLKETDLQRYPHEFSGGQKQRICIARALALEPALVICDEPVSALDVSIQAQILNLMKDLQKRFHLTYIFISHDLGVIEHMSDRVGVMYLGRLVELSDQHSLFSKPLHPYTLALLKAVPQIGQGKKRIQKTIIGDVPSPINPPSGCSFHPRCERAQERCQKEVPQLNTPSSGSSALEKEEKNQDAKVACFFPQSYV
ncbi:MAG: ATP-binding cassette domain-containing protein [Bdellovibrionaceae bacterium]|nr:ATP-binding cassette domain-containing protein [Pseudobdellovibrionaceae bacterium]MDW8190523.1 ATP-binding cassette domain-containing protein [Pseudobdellovibrionaceae bacterium]